MCTNVIRGVLITPEGLTGNGYANVLISRVLAYLTVISQDHMRLEMQF